MAAAHRDASPGLTRALGWASLGLGVPMVVAPGRVNAAIGVGTGPVAQWITRLVGIRELAQGAGLLLHGHRAWLWSRVGGDAVDLALLGRGLAHRGNPRTVAAMSAVTGVAGFDAYAAATGGEASGPVDMTGAVTVNRPPEEVYAAWRRLEDLPRFMAHLDEVRQVDARTSHWSATAPFGRTVEWEARITDEDPGSHIAWRSTDADIDNSGEVRFTPAPGGRGTEVRVRLRYAMPAGPLGHAVARYFGEAPEQALDDDLRRFKQVVETGDVTRSDGAPAGKRARHEFPQRPAQPLATDEEVPA